MDNGYIHVNIAGAQSPCYTNNWTEVAKQLDGFGKDAAEIESFKKAKGVFPAWFGTRYALNAPEVELGRHHEQPSVATRSQMTLTRLRKNCRLKNLHLRRRQGLSQTHHCDTRRVHFQEAVSRE
ncbi:hypothetical protein GQ600_6709 [Phytophthora cactorum]|nr:hypothetical protein GQ600_6709 [Phytophthora cactorum]